MLTSLKNGIIGNIGNVGNSRCILSGDTQVYLHLIN